MSGTYIDDATLLAIESDLESAHKTFGHGDLSLPTGKAMKAMGIRAVEVIGPAFALSYANAAAGGELMLGPLGVPADATIGASLVLLSAVGILGDDMEDHALNLGLGCLAAYGARAGASYGLAAAASNTPPSQTNGLPSHAGQVEMIGQGHARMGAPHAGRAAAQAMEGVAGTQRWYVRKA